MPSTERYLRAMTDQQLIDRFNAQVGLNAWGTARANYLHAMHMEFLRRSFDARLIANAQRMSFAKKIKLDGNKIVYGDPLTETE